MRFPVEFPSGAAILATLLVLVFVSVSSADAQVTAWGAAGGQLWSIGLPSGSMASVGPTGLPDNTFVVGMDRALDGRLLGLVVSVGTSAIYEFDTSTGQAKPFLTLDLDESMVGMAALDDGRIFVLHDSSIYEVNTATGATSFLVDVGPFGTLADDGSNLIAAVSGPGQMEIYSVDPDSGAPELIRSEPDFITARWASTVGPGGRLWLLRKSCPPLLGCSFAYQEIEDFGAGDSTTTDCCFYGFLDPQIQLSSLAWNGLSPAIAVPALRPVGQLLLTLLLVGAGWFVLGKQ